MFEDKLDPVVAPGVVARFDELLEGPDRAKTVESAALLERIGGGGALGEPGRGRAAGRCWAVVRLPALAPCGTKDWAVDTEEAVAAEVAAALPISQRLAATRVGYARAMRERLPKVGEVFAAGEIDFRLFTTIAHRTDLISDPEVLAAVDARLAASVARWPSMRRHRLAGRIDKVVAHADADALRRRTQHQSDREIGIDDLAEGGISLIRGGLLRPPMPTCWVRG